MHGAAAVPVVLPTPSSPENLSLLLLTNLIRQYNTKRA